MVKERSLFSPLVLVLVRCGAHLSHLFQEKEDVAQHSLAHAIVVAFREQRAFDHRPPTRKDWRSLGLFVHERIEPGGIGDLGSGCAVEAVAHHFTTPAIAETNS